MQKLLDLQTQLQETGVADRDLTITAGEGYLQVVDADMPDYPVSIVVAGDKMTCWTNIVPQSQIAEDGVAELNSALLAYNGIPGGLSNVGTGDGFYKLTGDLSADSKIESIVVELDSLLTSTVESLEIFVEFLA